MVSLKDPVSSIERLRVVVVGTFASGAGRDGQVVFGPGRVLGFSEIVILGLGCVCTFPIFELVGSFEVIGTLEPEVAFPPARTFLLAGDFG